MARTLIRVPLPVLLLVGALLALDLALLVAGGRPGGLSDPRAGFAVAVSLSQTSLVSIWAALGQAWPPIRFGALVLAVSALTVWMSRIPGVDGFCLIVPVHAIVAVFVLVAARLVARLELAPLATPKQFLVELLSFGSSDAMPVAPRRQSTILDLLGWTAALAVTLSVVKSLGGWELWARTMADILSAWFIWPLVLVRAALTLVLARSVLGTRWRAVMFAVLASLIVAGSWLLVAITRGDLGWVLSRLLAALHATELVLLSVWLAVLRAAGYRLWTRWDS